MNRFILYCVSFIIVLSSCQDSTPTIKDPNSGEGEVQTKLTLSAPSAGSYATTLRGTFQISGLDRTQCDIYYMCDKNVTTVENARKDFLNTGNISGLSTVNYPSEAAQFAVLVANLSSLQEYHYFVAIVNSNKTEASFASICSGMATFKTTTSLLPRIIQTIAVSVNQVELSCRIIRLGEYPIEERGVCYGTDANPTINNSKVVGENKNSYTVSLSDLSPDVVYYIRPYAVSGAVVVYGNTVNFPIREYTVTFDPNGGSGVMAPQTYLGGIYAPLIPNVFERKDHVFLGWSTSQEKAQSYSDKGSINTSTDLTLYAQWQKEPDTFMSDVDGNEYTVVRIGDQFWTVENWKATKYVDGTPIAQITDASKWSTTNSGAYSTYGNIVGNTNSYGLLYNWYTVNSGKLAPEGWRVPNDADWLVLENYLIVNGYNYDGSTGKSMVAKSMATVIDDDASWLESNAVGVIGNAQSYFFKNNSSGFTALPSGCRSNLGSFQYKSHCGYWWSLSEFDNTQASNRILGYYNLTLNRGSYNKNYGFSVRLVRDVPKVDPE